MPNSAGKAHFSDHRGTTWQILLHLTTNSFIRGSPFAQNLGTILLRGGAVAHRFFSIWQLQRPEVLRERLAWVLQSEAWRWAGCFQMSSHLLIEINGTQIGAHLHAFECIWGLLEMRDLRVAST